MKSKCYNVIVKFSKESENVIATACPCPARSSARFLGSCNHIGAVLFALEDFSRKKAKTSEEPLTCTSQLSKWNVSHDSSTNPVPIDKSLVKNKFGDNPSTEVELKNNCYDPHAPNYKHLNNASMNTWKKTFKSVYLPVDFFYSTIFSPDVQK